MKKVPVLAAVVLLQACAGGETGAPGGESIRAADLRADLHFLAGDAMRGRLVGTPESALASDYIKSRFERLGLRPAGTGGSYVQPFDLMSFSLGEENELVVQQEGAPLRLTLGRDFSPMDFSASAAGQGSLVYAGFGIVGPDFGHDDYQKHDLKGKIALVLQHEPGENDEKSVFDGLVTSEASHGWRKALAAQERGATAILFVDDVHNHGAVGLEPLHVFAWPGKPRRVERFNLASRMEKIRIPAAQISTAVASRLIAGSGKTLLELARAAETRGGGTPIELSGPSLSLRVSVKRTRVPARNVLGLIEGTDRKDELVIVCGHFDHEGAEGDRIFNGADDNGSGAVGVLEIAEAYALAGRRPRRSVLFAAWDAEERGLLGAWYYAELPGWPHQKIVAVLNMDMIGRNEEVREQSGRFRGLELQTAASNANAMNVIGMERCPDLRGEIERANGSVGLEIRFRYDNNLSNLLRRSDHWPFINFGVPGGWFFTGLHPDYHMTEDRPERINYEKMERVLRLVHQVSWDLADSERRPVLRKRIP
jgi:hypothetical protein